MAYRLIDLAVEAGADAVKFQVYRERDLYAGEIGEIFQELEMPDEMVPQLASYCQSQGIEFMASFFSERDFRVIDPHVKRHKIASPELHHPGLLELAAQSKKPVVLSTGISTMEEIAWAVDFFESGRLTLLQCNVDYPTPPAETNLRAMVYLREAFGCGAGLSDHTRDPILAPVGAVALGATIIEKHFTIHNRLIGPDHGFAVTGEELGEMVRAIGTMETMLGSGKKGIAQGEENLRQFSMRRVHASKPIAKGDVLKEGANLAILRSGHQKPGIHAKELKNVVGKVATRDIREGIGISWGDWE